MKVNIFRTYVRLTGKWLNNFWQLFYNDEIGKASNDKAFQ